MEVLLHKGVSDRTMILKDELCLFHFLYCTEKVDIIVFLSI